MLHITPGSRDELEYPVALIGLFLLFIGGSIAFRGIFSSVEHFKPKLNFVLDILKRPKRLGNVTEPLEVKITFSAYQRDSASRI